VGLGVGWVQLMRWWDQNIFVLLMYTATVTPFEVSFLGNGMGTLFYLNRYVDLAFIIDICLNFFLPIQVNIPPSPSNFDFAILNLFEPSAL
jgi:hypothetical protein